MSGGAVIDPQCEDCLAAMLDCLHDYVYEGDEDDV